MSKTIATVGIFLTEDERRHLTNLCNELEAREFAARRRNEGSEAQTRAAEQAALRKLMRLPAKNADAPRALPLCAVIGCTNDADPRWFARDMDGDRAMICDGHDPYPSPEMVATDRDHASATPSRGRKDAP